MKTKNVKLSLKDLFKGQVIYVAHPIYGIDEYKIVSPIPFYPISDFDSPFILAKWLYEGKEYDVDSLSLRDSGIDLRGKTDSYNGRRTFRKRKQAEEWMKKWSKDKGFIKQHEHHELMNDLFDEELDYWDDQYIELEDE